MRNPAELYDFPSWLDAQLAERDWKVADLARSAGISESIVHRWRKSERPNVASCRAIAKSFQLPVLEVMTIASVLKPDEVHDAADTIPPPLASMSTVELTRELKQRAESESWFSS